MSLILIVCSLWFAELHATRRRAVGLMEAIDNIHVGQSDRNEVTRELASFLTNRSTGYDCFGGPCLEGEIYRVGRKSPGIGDWWPATSLNVGLFYDHGILAIKEVEFSQSSGSTVRIVEDEYPFPDRHWDTSLPNGYQLDHKGNAVFIAMDQRASRSMKEQSFNLNLHCISSIHGCPHASELLGQDY